MSPPQPPSALPKRPRPTIEDVAKAADVALGTVSRVLNNFSDVNAGIRAQVLDAARSLNYTRIRQRKGGRRAQPLAGNIAVIFFGMEDTLAQLPVVSSALQGIETALAALGRNLMLASVPKGDRVPPFLTERRVDGLILKGPNQGLLPTPAQCRLLEQVYRVPHVWLMGRLANARGDHCNFDTDAAGRLAAEYLFSHGHRRLVFLDPKPGQVQFERLGSGFSAAAARLGANVTVLEAEPARSLNWPLPAITVQEKVAELVDRWAAMPVRTRPTALFVPSDRTTVQLYSALERLGLRAGRDLSIISCNNERTLLMDLNPLPATIDIHADFIGRRAVDQLFWRISHPDEPQCMQILVEPTLVEGASIATL